MELGFSAGKSLTYTVNTCDDTKTKLQEILRLGNGDKMGHKCGYNVMLQLQSLQCDGRIKSVRTTWDSLSTYWMKTKQKVLWWKVSLSFMCCTVFMYLLIITLVSFKHLLCYNNEVLLLISSTQVWIVIRERESVTSEKSFLRLGTDDLCFSSRHVFYTTLVVMAFT